MVNSVNRLPTASRSIPLAQRERSTPDSQHSAIGLSLHLREETADLHHQVERILGLPNTITTLDEYRSCLERFYQFYRPLESSLRRFSDWHRFGLELPEHAGWLALDLQALGLNPTDIDDAPQDSLPELPHFAHALGALYVMEGSTLGSQFILRHLTTVLGDEIAGTVAFFNGHGLRTGARWGIFRSSLDSYGVQHPETTLSVVHGAKATFEAIGNWMAK